MLCRSASASLGLRAGLVEMFSGWGTRAAAEAGESFRMSKSVVEGSEYVGGVWC